MPRAKPDSVIEHRIALGKWERDQIAPAIQLATVGTTVGIVAAGSGIALAAYGLYWFFDSGWGIRNKIRNHVDDLIERQGIDRQQVEDVADRVERSSGWTPTGIGFRISNWILGI